MIYSCAYLCEVSRQVGGVQTGDESRPPIVHVFSLFSTAGLHELFVKIARQVTVKCGQHALLRWHDNIACCGRLCVKKAACIPALRRRCGQRQGRRLDPLSAKSCTRSRGVKLAFDASPDETDDANLLTNATIRIDTLLPLMVAWVKSPRDGVANNSALSSNQSAESATSGSPAPKSADFPTWLFAVSGEFEGRKASLWKAVADHMQGQSHMLGLTQEDNDTDAGSM